MIRIRSKSCPRRAMAQFEMRPKVSSLGCCSAQWSSPGGALSFTLLRPRSGRGDQEGLPILAVMRLASGEQPLCKRLRKWLVSAGGTRRIKAPMPNQQRPPSIAILQDATGRLALFINGQRSIRRGKGQLALLACLLDNLGRAIPYKRLFTVIGRKSDNEYSRHLLAPIHLGAQGNTACKRSVLSHRDSP